MSVLNYDVLRTAKAALDEGLIDQPDYDTVKSSFLRAQQIKAGLDAGFIPEAEFTNVKRAFLESLDIGSKATDAHDQNHVLPAETSAAQAKQNAIPAPPQPKSQAPSRSTQPVPPVQPTPSNSTSQPHVPAPPAPSVTAAAPAQRPPSQQPDVAQPQPAATSGLVRLGRTEVPKNIPNLGGRRPKQSQATSMSGISVSEDAVNMYYFLKAKSSYRWATWMINNDGNEVVIADLGSKDSTYQDLLAVLPGSDCRYGVYDHQFKNSEGCIFNKLVFINWAPDAARIKAKMMYASTKDFFKGFLDGLSVELQGSDLGDISEQDVAEAVRSTVTRQ
ncbi:actin depolymerizing protein [Coccomyxa subellipsoidea C-169]|uniref:Actin depolymerizing protein n=1 Tax=Coccomyxa subellipsoidea (strain C-169) TaxID=574566 RepID=I0YPM1_COCSC|nr:actin depolymerizing protein [Coccomyxa subellipsoidea C-169]EIE20340.1 actin depolymerizing protein [Coccomyxa subellipsoidea C-169]|eukprot:XP_005644884.1 actin depolymerizing protein [Coccomyxa subellipsoidea C-169]